MLLEASPSPDSPDVCRMLVPLPIDSLLPEVVRSLSACPTLVPRSSAREPERRPESAARAPRCRAGRRNHRPRAPPAGGSSRRQAGRRGARGGRRRARGIPGSLRGRVERPNSGPVRNGRRAYPPDDLGSPAPRRADGPPRRVPRAALARRRRARASSSPPALDAPRPSRRRHVGYPRRGCNRLLSRGPFSSAPRAAGFDVAIEYLPAPDERPLHSQESRVREVRALVNDELDGDMLVFLPGVGEIRRARRSVRRRSRAMPKLLVVHSCMARPPGSGARPRDSSCRPAKGDPLDERGGIIRHDRRRGRGRRRRPSRGVVQRMPPWSGLPHSSGWRKSAARPLRSAPAGQGESAPGAACASTRRRITTRGASTT